VAVGLETTDLTALLPEWNTIHLTAATACAFARVLAGGGWSVPGAALQMHFHPGTVVVYTVQGAWTYDEGWVSEAGEVVFEVAGSTHLPRMVGKEDTIVSAVIEGARDFVDAAENTIATKN
jgi:hypothetical protein